MIYGIALTICFTCLTSSFVGPLPSRDLALEKPTEPLSPSPARGSDRETVKSGKKQPGSLLSLQPFLKEESVSIEVDGKSQTITLKNLNTLVNTWFVMHGSQIGKEFHLENKYPRRQAISLAPGSGHIIVSAPGKTMVCDFFSKDIQKTIADQRQDNRSFTEVCEGALYVRNPIAGRQTAKEFVAEFLRDNIWGGEELTTLVKETIYKDKFLLTSDAQKVAPTNDAAKNQNLAMPARIAVGKENSALEPKELGIKLQSNATQLVAGEWYPAQDQPGLAVSVYRADLVPEELLKTYGKSIARLDGTESSALAILVAMDMRQFDIHFAVGTEHPRVNWSERVPTELVDQSLAGPDGFDTIEPLVGTGKVPPHLRAKVEATFVGGFKRSHGAFKWGSLSQKNNGSHYGWMENGVVFSRLQPGLATIALTNDDEVIMKTWALDDDTALLPHLRHARQNGVPIIDGVDPETNVAVPGTLVNQWGAGNWSGSIDSKQRTLRSALCHQKTEAGEFLIYAYFSSATPSAMARVFQAYHCRYAIHLDMNALEHTYFATYRQEKDMFHIDHLNTGMDVLDSKHKGKALPRFVGQADNRDFFYLLRKEMAH